MDYKRGDIIIFEYENMLLVKRIIGKEGDKVKIENGEVFVNNKQLTETYLRAGIKSYLPSPEYANLVEGQESVVPKDSYFVLGDNRPASKDSRYKDVGFIKRDKMKGIVFLRFWPLDKFGFINGAQYN
jgi:signal peptidase I